VATARPNLARRPFVDSRPANLAAAVLLLAVVALTAVSYRTVRDYFEGSRKSREEIASLRSEIARIEASRREAEQKLSRFDLDGLRAGAEEANELARLRAFSWSRFLTRLERTLPNDCRIATVGLTRPKASERAKATAGDEFPVRLSLVSREPDALPKLLRTFYASPWFHSPVPVSEAGGDQGSEDGWNLSVSVLYVDRQEKP